jgi:hypothetical protein
VFFGIGTKEPFGIGEIIVKRTLFAAGIIVAIAAGIWQGPSVDYDARLSEVSGSGGPGCDYDGYITDTCKKTYDKKGCTGGNVTLSFEPTGGAGKQSHKRIGSKKATMDCEGGSKCPTSANTADLTTDGCKE